MPYDVREKDVPETLVASTMREASLDTIGKEIEQAYLDLMRAIAPVGYGTGVPGVICHQLPDQMTDGRWEVFMPVAAPFDAEEGIQVKRLPAGRVAYTVHVGPYEGCAQALGAVAAWIAAQGRRIAGPSRELYLNDPRTSGEEHAITEVQVPIG
jgi:effector-binding domain-containing protein